MPRGRCRLKTPPSLFSDSTFSELELHLPEALRSHLFHRNGIARPDAEKVLVDTAVVAAPAAGSLHRQKGQRVDLTVHFPLVQVDPLGVVDDQRIRCSTLLGGRSVEFVTEMVQVGVLISVLDSP